MSVAERHLDPAFAADDLSFVIEQVGTGNYADALQALSRAKAEDARNIFLIALEKQVTRLRNGGILPREKAEIVESLPGLVERARADHHARAASGESSVRSPESAASPAGERRDPRVKMVVDQYFRHADEWVRKRDFEAALKEIERVLLVDPENRVAKEYQSRVQQLFRIEHRQEPADFDAPVAASSPAVEENIVVAPGEKKVGRLVIFLSIGIAVIVMVIVGMMFRSPKGQYKVGYMYVSQTPPAAGEEQAVTAVVSAAEEKAGEEAVPEVTPDVKPPEQPRSSVDRKTSSTPPVKEEVQKVRESAPPSREPPVSEPAKSSPSPAAPSALAQPQRATEEAAAPAGFIPVEQPPKIVQLEQPSFSSDQVSRGIQGDIVVKVQIDKTGKPLQARVVSSTNPALDAAVVDAILRSSFTPGVMSTGPVTTWMTIPLKLK